MSKKQECNTCKQATKHDIYDLRITQCQECDGWDMPEIHWLLALKMKELGFNWHEFANKIDEMASKGTAKELFFKSVGEHQKGD